jgi:lactoylglutathione lyase
VIRQLPLVLALAVFTSAPVRSDDPAVATAADTAVDSPFTGTTIDIGMVVSDVARSQKFYEEAVGFAKVGGFTVPVEMGADSGLSDDQPFDVTMLTLGGAGETATKLKLMQFHRKPGARQDLRFVHSTLGVSYLTIHVRDLHAAVERAGKAGVKPIAKGITAVPFAAGVGIALIRDPDGNFVELVGPMAKPAEKAE